MYIINEEIAYDKQGVYRGHNKEALSKGLSFWTPEVFLHLRDDLERLAARSSLGQPFESVIIGFVIR